MIGHIVSAVSAVLVSVRYASTLRIGIREMPLYLRKSFNLALCYAGFVSKQNYFQARRAGIAAFLSCAYDVVTDWRGFQEGGIRAFDNILRKNTPDSLRALALDLLAKDRRGELSYDGLERGTTSARFIMGLIGSESYFERLADLNRLGMALQVVDDVLDYEGDVRSGHTNCLLSVRREEYMMLLGETLSESEIARLFPNGQVLRHVIKRANEKVQGLRASFKS